MPCQLMLPCESERATVAGGDLLRALTPGGRSHALAIAGELSRILLGPLHRVLSLPVVRAIETAQVVACELAPEISVEVLLPRRPESSVADLGALVRELSEADANVLVVLPQPELPSVLHRLARLSFDTLRSADTLPLTLAPGTVVSLRSAASGCDVLFSMNGARVVPSH